MPVSTSTLLITSRDDLRDTVTRHAAGVPVTVSAPDCLTSHAWARASAVLIDSHAAVTVATLGLPHRSNLHVLTDDAAEPRVWEHAVKLDAERVLVLPDAFPALRETLRAVSRHPAVAVVVGVARTAAATTFVAAAGIGHLARGRRVAVIGARSDPVPLDERIKVDRSATHGQQPGSGMLTVMTHSIDGPVPADDLAAAVTDLRSDHDVIIVDAAPPPDAAGMLALEWADLVIVVAAPSELDAPAARELAASLTRLALRAQLAVLAGPDEDPYDGIARGLELGFDHVRALQLGQAPDHPSLVADASYRNWCADALAEAE